MFIIFLNFLFQKQILKCKQINFVRRTTIIDLCGRKSVKATCTKLSKHYDTVAVVVHSHTNIYIYIHCIYIYIYITLTYMFRAANI